jgi:hypothetical protein
MLDDNVCNSGVGNDGFGIIKLVMVSKFFDAYLKKHVEGGIVRTIQLSSIQTVSKDDVAGLNVLARLCLSGIGTRGAGLICRSSCRPTTRQPNPRESGTESLTAPCYGNCCCVSLTLSLM